MAASCCHGNDNKKASLGDGRLEKSTDLKLTSLKGKLGMEVDRQANKQTGGQRETQREREMYTVHILSYNFWVDGYMCVYIT